jgi:putative DNA primase/helicase
MKRGYFMLPTMEGGARLEDLSSPISAFLRTRCVIGSQCSVPKDEIWAAWKQWCEDENCGVGTKAMFGKDLFAAVPTMKAIRPRNGDDRQQKYAGIGLRDMEHAMHGQADHPDRN